MENVLEKRYHWTHRYSKVFVYYYWRNGQLIMDEPERIDGKDLGPDPFLHS
jgi:putative redox protein